MSLHFKSEISLFRIGAFQWECLRIVKRVSVDMAVHSERRKLRCILYICLIFLWISYKIYKKFIRRISNIVLNTCSMESGCHLGWSRFQTKKKLFLSLVYPKPHLNPPISFWYLPVQYYLIQSKQFQVVV